MSDQANLANAATPTPGVDYHELAPRVAEQLAGETVAGQLAARTIEVAEQRALAEHLARQLATTRRHAGQLEEALDMQRRLDAQRLRREHELDGIAHAAGVVLDRAGTAILEEEDPGSIDGNGVLLRPVAEDIDRTHRQVVLVPVMALDVLSEALRDAYEGGRPGPRDEDRDGDTGPATVHHAHQSDDGEQGYHHEHSDGNRPHRHADDMAWRQP